MNPAALKIKGSPLTCSTEVNQTKRGQLPLLVPVVSGIRLGTDSRLFRKERKGRKVGIRFSLSCSLDRISVERTP